MALPRPHLMLIPTSVLITGSSPAAPSSARWPLAIAPRAARTAPRHCTERTAAAQRRGRWQAGAPKAGTAEAPLSRSD